MRIALGFSLALLAGCSGQRFENAAIQTYVGTWGFNLSQVNINCDDGTSQAVSGSGQLKLTIGTDTATLSADVEDECTGVVLTRDDSGYSVTTPTTCPKGTLQSVHIAVSTHDSDSMAFTSNFKTAANDTTCTKVENATAMRSR